MKKLKFCRKNVFYFDHVSVVRLDLFLLGGLMTPQAQTQNLNDKCRTPKLCK